MELPTYWKTSLVVVQFRRTEMVQLTKQNKSIKIINNVIKAGSLHAENYAFPNVSGD